ncbi:hypothetical protein LTR37_007473 [Vermiconidia calcicola]|uniref:Uncharacterized protein n=1 Tax=Vermiconidia calcicola TaxID=1690605 RepID=A0ACC3NGD5_9PEZI|nr:hypothetical protein LTR37_007473 [Vermiconidia calcicola]
MSGRNSRSRVNPVKEPLDEGMPPGNNVHVLNLNLQSSLARLAILHRRLKCAHRRRQILDDWTRVITGQTGYLAPSNQARPPLPSIQPRPVQPGPVQPGVVQGPAPTAPNPAGPAPYTELYNRYSSGGGAPATGSWYHSASPAMAKTANQDIIRRQPGYVAYQAVDEQSGVSAYNPNAPQYPRYARGQGDRLSEAQWALDRPQQAAPGETVSLEVRGATNQPGYDWQYWNNAVQQGGYVPRDLAFNCGDPGCRGCNGTGIGPRNCHPSEQEGRGIEDYRYP